MATRSTVTPTDRTFDLGVIKLRLLADSAETGGGFALGEFTGGEGPWTVPHVHLDHDESFFVLDGEFTFTVGDEQWVYGPGSYIRIPRDVRHLIHAGPGGGRMLTLWVPGGLEAMFIELSRLPADSLRDPATRQALSARFDSKPV